MNSKMTDAKNAKIGSEIDLGEIFRVIWASKYVLAAFMFGALIFGVFYILRSEPIYQANALLQLEQRTASMTLPINMQGLMGDEQGSGVEAEAQIIRSRLVLGEAVKAVDMQISAMPKALPVLGLLPKRLGLPEFGLGLLRRYQWGDEHIHVAELEVPEKWLISQVRGAGEKRITLTIAGDGIYSVELPDGSRHDGELRKRLSLPELGFSLVVDELAGPVGRQFLLGRRSVEVAILDIAKNFTVSEAATGSSILQIAIKYPDPHEAEVILNAVAQAYASQNLMRSAAEADNSLKFIEDQLPVAQKDVTDAQQALNEYRQRQQSVDVDYETKSLLEQATQIEAQLNQLSLEEEELKQKYTPNHPRYQLLIENRLSLEKMLENIRKETGNLPETQKEIFNLSRDLQVSQDSYVQLLNRAQELRVVKASTVGSVRIVDPAYSDGERISPKTSQTLILALVVGSLVGTGFILIRKSTRQGVRGTQYLEQIGLPVFATVNYAPEAAGNRKSKGNLPIHVLTHPDDLASEAIRSLRTSLHFGLLDAKTNTVQMTSPAPQAGKSFVTVNLAVSLAQAGQRVCLIDADLRRGYMRRYLGKPKGTPGLAEVLAREKTVDEVIIPGPVDGLSVILNGRHPPNPSELLMRQEFEQLIEYLNTQFDIVLLDSAPALAVTDPIVIARYVGASIMVVRHLETPPGEIEATRQAFASAGVKLSGAILNGYRPEMVQKFGGTQQYSYRYAYKSENADQ